MLDRRTFLSASAAMLLLGRSSRAQAPGPLALDALSIDELGARLRAGSLTVSGLTRASLERIDALDRRGPTLRSVLETNPDALTDADQLDAELKAHRPRGPLHGIPVLFKDNVDVAGKMSTSAGSLALLDRAPAADAPVVARLRAAGALILGKTNLSEWANARGDRPTSGWSARGGVVRNPYALDRNACGSSSGSAAAVSAGLCALAVGTETLGSIQCPASLCGVVGIKPTIGLLPSAGIIPVSHTCDTPGPLARSVRDAWLGLLAMGARLDARGLDGADGALKGARVGVNRAQWGQDPRERALLEANVSALTAEGAVVVEVPLVDGMAHWPELLELWHVELKDDMGRYLAARGGKERTLADLIAFNEAHKERELAFFGQEQFVAANASGPMAGPRYAELLRKAEAAHEEARALFGEHRLDVVFQPTAGLPWLTDLVLGDHSEVEGSALLSMARGPVVTVPGGFVSGLPFGVNFEGLRGDDVRVIRLAHAFERATRLRRAPAFAPSAPAGG